MLIFDIVMSILFGHRGGVTCFLLPGHSHFYADTIGASAKAQISGRVAYTSEEICDLIRGSKRVTRIEEIEKIADWSGIIPLFRKLPVNFTKNYYFVWTLPQGESDGPVTMGMYKFGGYRGENVLLCSSVVEVKEKLFRLLFGKAPVVVSTILKSLLKLPLVEPRWVDDDKSEVFPMVSN